MKPTKAEQVEALEFLHKHLKPGDTVTTIQRHVSRSGMSRRISPVIIINGETRDISWHVSKLGSYNLSKRHDGLIVSGCGMDMGFALVYDLSYKLFPDGFGIEGQASLYPQGIRPVTKEHADKLNGQGVQFRGRNGDTSGWDKDGGYALKQRWL